MINILMWSITLKRLVCSATFIVLISLLFITCQKKKETATRPAVAMLLKPGYAPDDTVSILLSQPLSRVAVTLDNKVVSVIQQSGNELFIKPVSEKMGLHQLVVRGLSTDETAISDTLSIEFWSDITPRSLSFSVVKTYPHQTSSFTQGLEFYRGVLYESTGLNGKSNLMKIDLPTGSILKSVPLPEHYFGEGITILNDKIYQLTWTSGVGFRYNMDFTLKKTVNYPTEGWGLTHKDSTLILSDGSNKLYFLKPDFTRKGELAVYDNTGPVMNLNELEYANGYVFANIWQTNRIVQIDVTSGKVVGNLNMEAILPAGVDTKTNVLNGIAFQPADNTFYVTGKNWPTLIKIRLNNYLSDKRIL